MEKGDSQSKLYAGLLPPRPPNNPIVSAPTRRCNDGSGLGVTPC
jgi:hypothetical protein